MRFKKEWLPVFLLLAVFINLSKATPEEINGEKKALQNNALDDSSRVYPPKMSSHTTLEKVVNFPGTVLNLPFRLFFGAFGKTAGVVYESPKLALLRALVYPKITTRGVQAVGSKRSGYGLRFYQRDLFGKGSLTQVRFSHGVVSKKQKHYVRFLNVPLGRRFFASMFVQYRFLNDESFFGLGPETVYEDELEYSLEKRTVRVQLGPRFGTTASLRAFAEYNRYKASDYRDEDEPSLTTEPPDSLPGSNAPAKIQGFGLELTVDTRDHRGLTTTGWELNASASINTQRDGDDFRYWRISLDVKRHLHLFSLRRLTLRLAAERNRPLNGHEVPFYNLSALGRRESIRGYSRGRFRDNDMIMGSLEYHYPIWRFFDWMWFFDAGRVSPNIFKEINTGRFAAAAGGGLIIRSQNQRILRILFGVSQDQARLYFILK